MENIESRLSAIRARREALDKEAADKATAEEIKRKELVAQIKALAPRLRDLVTIGREIAAHSIPFGEKTGDNIPSGSLLANSFSKRVGYLQTNALIGNRVFFDWIGQRDATCYGEHGIAVSENGDVITPDEWFLCSSKDCFVFPEHKAFIACAEKFLAGFDEFEKRVSDYLDKLAKQNNK